MKTFSCKKCSTEICHLVDDGEQKSVTIEKNELELIPVTFDEDKVEYSAPSHKIILGFKNIVKFLEVRCSNCKKSIGYKRSGKRATNKIMADDEFVKKYCAMLSEKKGLNMKPSILKLIVCSKS